MHNPLVFCLVLILFALTQNLPETDASRGLEGHARVEAAISCLVALMQVLAIKRPVMCVIGMLSAA